VSSVVQNEVLRHLLLPLAAGCLGGAVAVCGLIVVNTGSLRELILHSQSGWLAALLLCLGFVSTFGAVAVGLAVCRGETTG
jgi:hypothetical protein